VTLVFLNFHLASSFLSFVFFLFIQSFDDHLRQDVKSLVFLLHLSSQHVSFKLPLVFYSWLFLFQVTFTAVCLHILKPSLNDPHLLAAVFTAARLLRTGRC